MGSVWLAERSDGRFERRVAVKFLNIALMGKVGEERFKLDNIQRVRVRSPPQIWLRRSWTSNHRECRMW
jgi:serine/threonine-protein kinase